MLNRITVQGRLTHTPELKRTQSGISVCSFSVACERDFKAQDGSRETDFIDVVAWRQTAEFVTSYLVKGRMALVDGRLQIREYQGRDGQKKRAAEIIADHVYFCDKKPEGQQSGQQYGTQYGAPPPQYSGGGYGGGPPQYGAAPRGGVLVSAPNENPETGTYLNGVIDEDGRYEADGDLPF